MNNIDYVNLEPSSDAPVTWRDYAAPVISIALALLFWRVFGLESFFVYGPGLGVLVFVLAYDAAVFLTLGAPRDPGAIGLMAVSACLALCCALYRYPSFMVINCFGILLTSAMATFRLSGQATAGFLSIHSIPETIQLAVFALFSRIAPPLKRLMIGTENRKKVWIAAVSAAVSLVLLAVVLALLASADRIFGSFFDDIAERLRSLALESVIWRIVRVVALALLISSGLYFIRTEPPLPRQEKPVRQKHLLPFLLPSLLLDAVYVIFCAVQLRYLFGGAEAAAIAGGWAEYARTGFFQLVAVAVINLTLCGAGADKRRFGEKGGLALRIAQGIMIVLTLMILLSALRRMQLYILAFGMSVLRLMTLWGMAAVAAGLIALAYKLWRPDFSFFPVFFGFALTTWCVLCLINPAGQVARYNVDAYLEGALSSVDTEYLQELTPDAAPALERLAERSGEYRAEAETVLASFAEEEHVSWPCLKLFG